MSRELRKATLHTCESYLRQLDYVKELAEKLAITDDDDDSSSWADSVLQKGEDDYDGGETLCIDGDDEHDGSPAEDTETRKPIGSTELPYQPTTSPPVTPPTSPPCNADPATSAAPAREHAITRADMDKFVLFHDAMRRIVESLRSGIVPLRQTPARPGQGPVRLHVGTGLQGRGPGIPTQAARGHVLRVADRREMMDDDWLWEQECAEAWRKSDVSYRHDDLNRRVVKL